MALIGVLVAACSTTQPQVRVLGVTETARAPSAPAHTLLIHLEVINPTGYELQLSRLEYAFRAVPTIDSHGDVTLSRALGADSTAVVEVPVELTEAALSGLAGELGYSLEGTLFAVDSNSVRRSWKVEAVGELSSDMVAVSPRVRMRIAGDD